MLKRLDNIGIAVREIGRAIEFYTTKLGMEGSAFGSEGYIRLSFATSMEQLKKALERIAKALA